MKLNSNQFKVWKKNNDLFSIKYFLIYGYDQSNVSLITTDIIEEFKEKGEVTAIKINYKNIKDDYHFLIDELKSSSLFDDTKIIVLEECPASLPKYLNEFLSESFLTAKLILNAMELKPTSSLRKITEASKNSLSIACYKDDARQIGEFVRSYLIEKNVKFDPQIVHVLVQMLPSSRMIIKNELDKLILYVNNNLITIEDVQDVIFDSHEMVLDDLCLAVVRNDKPQILQLLDTAINNDINYVFILRVLQKYYIRLLEICSYIESGLNVEMAINKLIPPVFFKQRDNLVKICHDKNIINKQKILMMNADLLQLELDCKSLGVDVYIHISNFFNSRVVT